MNSYEYNILSYYDGLVILYFSVFYKTKVKLDLIYKTLNLYFMCSLKSSHNSGLRYRGKNMNFNYLSIKSTVTI